MLNQTTPDGWGAQPRALGGAGQLYSRKQSRVSVGIPPLQCGYSYLPAASLCGVACGACRACTATFLAVLVVSLWMCRGTMTTGGALFRLLPAGDWSATARLPHSAAYRQFTGDCARPLLSSTPPQPPIVPWEDGVAVNPWRRAGTELPASLSAPAGPGNTG